MPRKTRMTDGAARFSLLALALIAAGCALERIERPPAPFAVVGVVATADAPTIDGRLDDAAWARAGKTSAFVVLSSDKKAVEQTVVSLLYNEEHLFIGVRCAESQMDSVKATVRLRDTTDVAADDSIEIFLIPPKNAFLDQFPAPERYFHIMLNVLGTQYDEIGMNSPTAWDAKWDAATSRGKDHWEAEIAMPFSALSAAPPAPGSVWTANFNRGEKRLGEYSAWSPVYSSFHDAANFGRVVFVRAPKRPQALDAMALREGLLLPHAEEMARAFERSGDVLGALRGGIAPLRETRRSHRRATRQLARLVNQIRRLSDARLLAAWKRIEVELDRLAKEAEAVSDKALLLRSYADAELAGDEPPPAYCVFVAPAITNEKLLPHRFPKGAAPAGQISISACAEEIEPATFCVLALQDLEDVRVTVGPMTRKGNRVSLSPEVDVRLVKCWYQAGVQIWDANHKLLTPELLLKDDALVRVDFEKEENFLRTTGADGREAYVSISTKDSKHLTDVAPKDAESLQPVDIPAKRLQQFWLTISVPAGAAPGEYRSMVRIQVTGLPDREVPLIVRVLPFELEASMLTYSIYYRARLTHAGKGSISSETKSAEQYLAEVKDMKAHGVLYPSVYQAYGKDLLRQVLELRAEAGLPTGMFFGLGRGTRSPATQAELDGLARDVKKWRAFVAPYGYDEVYFYGLDEAQGERQKRQRAAWKTVREAGGKTFVACYRGTFEAMGDLLDVAVFSGGLDPKEATKFHGVGNRIFSYGNPQVGVEEPETYRRNFGLLLWQSDYDGAMDYAYQHGFNHIWNDFDHGRYRDHVFAYPTVDGVVGTIQWEGFREGVDDIRYLTTLLGAIAKAKKSTTKRTRDEAVSAEEYLEELKACDLAAKSLDAIRSEMIAWTLKLLPGAAAGEDRSYACRRLAGPPVLDGRIRGDRAWEGVAEATGFLRLRSHTAAPKQTSFRMGYTPEALYIGVECEDPDVDAIKARLGDGRNVWAQDSVEVFIFPEGADAYLQFVVSSIGSRWSWRFLAALTRDREIPLGSWTAETFKGADYWSVEIEIPWKAFLRLPVQNEKWRVNVGRNCYTSGPTHTSWAYLKGIFHEPSHFGALTFKDKIRAWEGTGAKGEILSSLDEKIAANLKSVSRLRRELLKDPGPSEEAGAFLKEYDEIRRKASRIRSTSTLRANRLLKRSLALVGRAERLKEERLLKGLLGDD